VFRDRWDVLLVIAAGGALGSLARWAVNEAMPPQVDGVPWATAVENVSGGLVLGALMVLILDFWPPSRYLRPFVAVGILGGYTTFSTYMLDTRDLLAAGRVPAAAGYLFGTLLAGLIGVGLGVMAARYVAGAAQRRHRERREHRDESTAHATPRRRR
jgi:fluoride exporter